MDGYAGGEVRLLFETDGRSTCWVIFAGFCSMNDEDSRSRLFHYWQVVSDYLPGVSMSLAHEIADPRLARTLAFQKNSPRS